MSVCYVTTGQRPQIRQTETRLMAPPAGSVMVRSVPASFVSPQRMPPHEISSLPQPSPQIIAGPSMTFPSQSAPQPQVYTGVPPDHGIPLQQPSVLAGQPNFPNQNLIGQQPQQQQGLNIVRPVGGATVQPIYRNVEPLNPQQPPNQPSFLLANPPQVQQPAHQPVIYQRLLTPAGDRPQFEGNIVRSQMPMPSSLPGYIDFGGGEGNQVHFKTDLYSDPEIVGQPIETVIHNRKRQERIGDSRAPAGFGQHKAKQFLGAK